MPDPTTVAVGAIVGMLVLLIIGVPVAIALGFSGLVGLALIGGWPLALSQVQSLPYNMSAEYAFAVIPTFVFMGNLAMGAGMAKELYDAANRWLGHLTGGLYLATIAGSAAFGAASGSTLVNATVFTRVALPEMLRLGYSKKTASACIASVGTLDAMIPPSIAMVIYGIITETSIGKLMVAGIVPGIASALAYCVLMIALVKWKPEIAPMRLPRASWAERLRSLSGTWAILLLFGVVMGGIYAGLFSPSAAGAVGAFGALVIVMARGQLTWSMLWSSLVGSAVTTAMLFMIIIGGLLFSRMLVLSNVVTDAVEWVSALGLSPMALVIMLCVMYLVLGSLVDALSMLIVTLPFVFPLISKAGIDPIWFGILCVQLLELGAMHPPIGLNLFATVSASDGQITIEDIVEGIIPFIILNLIILAVLIAFPQIVLWLPGQMKL